MITLKGGRRTKDPRLDRIPQFDPRSREFRVRTLVMAGEPLERRRPRSYTWGVNHWLDQGVEGRCVEFAVCHDLLARPGQVSPGLVERILEEKLIYWPAQQEDEWPGGSYEGANPEYEGTSVLAGVKVAKRMGLYGEYRWATTLGGALVGLGYVGPLILGVNWYEEMYDTKNDGWINVDGEVTGGHAILAHAVRIYWRMPPPRDLPLDTVVDEFLDWDRSYVVLHNSWGPAWGVKGRAKLSVRDFDRLRREEGEVCIISRRFVPKTLAA